MSRDTGRRRPKHALPKSNKRWSVSKTAAGRTIFALLACGSLVVTGAGWQVFYKAFSHVPTSGAEAEGGKSSDGSMNMLLIGLDSRKDQDGNDLPRAVLNQLHAGDSDAGGYNTNTLILVHVGADNKVTAFSIPRDDWVPAEGIPGYRHIKIKEAYGLTKANEADKLVNEGITDQATLEQQSREAGRRATLNAVHRLTGQPIDYFAEVNLVGFYDLASELGGITVCLNNAVYDSYSGANFPAGEQTLNASQALAFVRQRHGLENGDLDRTHRQQAFLISVMQQLRNAGTLTDITKLNGLMNVVHKDVVLSKGWTEKQFQRLGQIADGNVNFQTLPVVRYDNINGADVNIVDPVAIRAKVAAAFKGEDAAPASAATTPTSTVDVVNATSTSGLASTVSSALVSRGYTKGDVRDPLSGESTGTAIDYGVGADADAKAMSTMLGIETEPVADPTLAPGRIRVMLGTGYSAPSDVLSAEDSGTASSMSSSSSSGSAGDYAPPDSGKPVVSSNSGVPCVN
ncbi:LCP family protein [Mycobacteroides abscessus]|uniref:LCP family protein n=1 Tax=Mycobacteroides abscessus TaxID=36809 RepID=UPI00092CA85A|nr:LCP family protein [Mycobacteroides abscessus]MDO3333176.1 LCP family protein [Mycobacteroides abscessus subsp. bolletii]QSM89668.1 LCP family protein [Mycobacteroides abscessus subsp. bolletii]SIB99268.1 transcriptional regulator lytR [Mycobacteroides abscessus subsp. bolletii]SIJ95004.1 transcriptional regulator lytR [Mycobacteroides abscessus subsp. bolletii]SKT67813.1 transcriptional regulator lytR [Mycobacteroides abscessus subsp. bolletii]